MIVKTPPMGWNTWNTFGECYNEEVLREIADALVDRGFAEAGYNHLIIDDHWVMEHRDPETHRLIPRPGKFPNGIEPVVSYVHGKGLKFGVYSCVGARTCGAKMGSFEYEFTDAEWFSEIGVDYLKHDYCLRPEKSNGETLYRRMALALRDSGRDTVFAACNWGCDDVWSWIRSIGAHTYRSTGDICDNFKSFTDIFRSQVFKLGASASGCFNDLDMITVGMDGEGNVGTSELLTEGVYRIQFCVWCMFGSPLILGCDVRTVKDKYRDLLCNSELIRINQDPECRSPFPVAFDDALVFCRLLDGGDIAVLLINVNDNACNMSFLPYDIGLTEESGYKLSMKDVLNGDTFEASDIMFVPVPPKDCRMLRGRLVRK